MSVPPYASEVTRLLCAGAYTDAGYRDRVIEELHLNEQRFVAPSLGFDAARVLAHALRARRLELAWAGGILALLVIGALATQYLLLVILFPSVLLVVARWVRGTSEQPPVYRRLPAFWLRWVGRWYLVVILVITVMSGFGKADAQDANPLPGLSRTVTDTFTDNSGYGYGDAGYGDTGYDGSGDSGSDGPGALEAWLSLAFLLAMGGCAMGQRRQFAAALRGELSPERFRDAASDPAEKADSPRFQRLKARIRVEQHAQLIMYNAARPFCGAGLAHDTWVLAVELRPDRTRKQEPLGNRRILDQVVPLVESLREPAALATGEGRPVRDRLRLLQVDECVFLPADGLSARDEAPFDEEAFARHKEGAVEEGAEKRRHFVRVRVGGWDEDLVVTVFVRVHTQGGMLMLEIAPHVLYPVRAQFKNADRLAYRFRHNSAVGKAAWAVTHSPAAPFEALTTLGRGVAHGWRRLTGGFAHALPDGPALSVRELAAADQASLFQEMDVARYLRSIQDRVAGGVKVALAEAGYQTGEFVQKIVNISNGGVNIDSVEGSTFAVGNQARATTNTHGGTTAPPAQNGASGDDDE